MKKFIVLFVLSIEKLKALKYHVFSKKAFVFSIICIKFEIKDEVILKKKKQLKY